MCKLIQECKGYNTVDVHAIAKEGWGEIGRVGPEKPQFGSVECVPFLPAEEVHHVMP